MLKRLHIYFKERYPIIPRLFVGFIVFLEIHFIVLLNYGVTDFHVTIQEFVGGFTIFGFLLFLRIADDFKDYETDMVLFPERPLPSGRVKKSDLTVVLVIDIVAMVALNLIFMWENILFFLILMVYGTLMSVWFFQKSKIQKSLPFALVTHNPVQMVMNIYVIAFTCIKYNLDWLSLTTFLAAFTLYFPALIWEVSRKIRAPRDETDYVTYSKLFGYKKATRFVLILTLVDIVTNILLVINLNIISSAVLVVLVSVMTWNFVAFMKNPERFMLVDRVEKYTYFQESTMLLTVVLYLIVGRI